MTDQLFGHWWRKCIFVVSVFLFHAAFCGNAAARDGTADPAAAPEPKPIVDVLQGILIVPGKAGAKNAQELLSNVNPDGVRGVKGVVIKGPTFLRATDLQRQLATHLGFPLYNEGLKQIQTNLVDYCRVRGHPVVDVFYPEQDVLEGTIQIVVLEGRIGNITVTNESPRKWFSTSLVLRDLSLKKGGVVTDSQLSGDLAWLNRNSHQSLGYDAFGGPFMDVTATFKQGELGQTDVELNVKDRFPFRAFAGVDDTGIEAIGKNRAFAGFNWANVFGLDHRLTYEFVTDTDFRRFREHVASYVIPLPWRHEFTVFGAYADLDPDFSKINPAFTGFKNEGQFYQLSARYAVPLPATRNYNHEISAGFDFKRTDTPLVFESTSASSVIKTNEIDIAQFTLGYSGRFRDPLGRTAFSIQGVYSPGGLTSHNHDADFSDFSTGTKSEYLYGRAELRRETLLYQFNYDGDGYDFSWYVRAIGQFSDAKLAATEAFTVGGYDTVRGYDERIVSGDHGWLLVNEIRLPRLILGNLTGKEKAKDWIQPLFFCDYGGAVNRRPLVSQRYEEVLLSVGVGVRFQVADNFRVRFDYGFQLDQEYPDWTECRVPGQTIG